MQDSSDPYHRTPGFFQLQRLNICQLFSIQSGDDSWIFLAVLLIFWFFASMTMILGFYGSMSIQLGPNCSRLIRVSPFFVQSIKAQQVGDNPQPGPALYGFYDLPSLNVEVTWSEMHEISIRPSYHKKWIYFLNRGSKVDISYKVESPSAFLLSLVISQGKDSLVQWIEDPLFPNTTLSWNIINGTGRIQQEIWMSSDYYIAVGNLNFEEVQVQLNLTMTSLQYNKTQAYYRCSLSQYLCAVKLFLFRNEVAVLASPGPEQGLTDDWHVTLSFGPRWITYIVGSGVMTLVILLVVRIINMCGNNNRNATRFHETASEQQPPLLSHKDSDLSSLGSSYDSVSNDDEGPEDCPSHNGKNLRRPCSICFDAPRDCFFLPCGHCAACYTCGMRIAEEVGICPICRKKLKKVRKIFTV